MKTSTLSKIIKFLIFLSVLIPLVIFRNYVSPFHFGKIMYFRPLVELMAAFYIILAIKDRSYLPHPKKILQAFILFAVLFGISTIFSTNPYLSFWGSLERMGGFWNFLHYLVFFTILTSVMRTKKDWFYFLSLVVSVAVASAFYGFLQKTNISWIMGSGGRGRIFGTIGNPALFAGYQIVSLFLALTLAVSSFTTMKMKPYFYSAVAINLIAVFMTVVRGSVLAVVVGLTVMMISYLLVSGSAKAKKGLMAMGILIVCFFLFATFFRDSSIVRSSGFLRRMTDFSLNTFTVQTRFWAWQAGLEGWKETPKTVLLGWGPENFNVPFSKHFNPKFFTGSGAETLFDRAHNMFVEVLVTMGLLAFLAYLSIFWFSVKSLWRGMKEKIIESKLGVGLIALVVAYMVHNFFIFDTSANFIIFFSVLGFISAVSEGELFKIQDDRNNKKQQQPNYKIGFGLTMLMSAFIIVVAILAFRTSILPARANFASTRAIIATWNKDIPGAVAKYKEAISYNVPGKYEFRNNFAQFVLEQFNGNKLTSQDIQVVLSAIDGVKQNTIETKLDYLPYLYLSRLYITLGKSDPKSPYNDEALRNSMKALEISPKFVRTYYEVAQGYLNKKDYQNGIKYFQEAINLNPDVGLSHFYLGATYIEVGDNEKGLAEMDVARKLNYYFSESDALRLSDLYIKKGDYIRTAEWLELLTELNPNNPQYHASLAADYAKIGRIDEAVVEAKKAAALDKSFEPEARAFVKSLGREY